MKRSFMMMILTVVVFAHAFSGHVLTVYADTVTHPNASGFDKDVPGVSQGLTDKDFILKAPIVAIYIDEDKINSRTARDNAIVTPLYATNSDPRAKGLTHGPVTKAENFGEEAGNNFLIFDQNSPSLDPAYKLQRGQNNTISGPLISYTFQGAAQYNGKPADVVFTYSNANIVLQNNLSDENYALLDKFSIAGGNLIQVAGTQKDALGNVSKSVGYLKEGGVDKSQEQRYGITVDVNVQVLQGGKPVPGGFYFRMVDIDIVRTGSFANLFGAGSNNNYSEQVLLRDGFQTHNGYDVYIPGGEYDTGNAENLRGYKCDISPSGAGYKFDPLIEDKQGNGTFYSGFMTVAENSTGINLTCWAGGAGNAPIKTVLLAGFQGNNGIVYDVVSKTGDGGSIKTTTGGNADGTLNDGTVIGPDAPNQEHSLMVSQGKEITYTMTPDTADCYPTSVKVDLGDGLGLREVLPSVTQNTDGNWVYTFSYAQEHRVKKAHKYGLCGSPNGYTYTSFTPLLRKDTETRQKADKIKENRLF